MRTYDICIQTGNTYSSAEVCHQLGQEFEKGGWSIFYWCDQADAGRYFDQAGIEDYFVLATRREQLQGKNLDSMALRTFLAANGFPNLNFFFFTQALQSQMQHQQDFWIEESLERTAAVKDFVAESRIVCKRCLTYKGDEIYHNTFKLFARAISADLVFFSQIPYFHDRMGMTREMNGVWRADSYRTEYDRDEALRYVLNLRDHIVQNKTLESDAPPLRLNFALNAFIKKTYAAARMLRSKASRPVENNVHRVNKACLLYTSPSPRDNRVSRMPSSA